MAININGPGSTQVGTGKTQKNNEAATAEVKSSSAGTEAAKSDDVVQLSDKARVMKAVESRIQSMPEIDQEKVDRIRNAITNGEYNIDYEKLAAAFRRFESEL